MTLPPAGYLEGAQELCRRYGTLFVVDEIQTGLGRTGRWFALEHSGLNPDVVLVGKALSGWLHAGSRDGYDPSDLRPGRRHARALVRPPVDLRPQPPLDGRRPGDASDHRARRPGRAGRAHRRDAASTGYESFRIATK